ncbi:MAG TPA: hypothetical protein VGS07_31600 [Thermoanaerobaculia bacterium]|nr:hypothetical protein [Thermoanaerobaculia bacterium]
MANPRLERTGGRPARHDRASVAADRDEVEKAAKERLTLTPAAPR